MYHVEPFGKNQITDQNGADYSVGLGTVIKADAKWRIVDTRKHHYPKGEERLKVVNPEHTVDDTLAASPASILYYQYASYHFATAFVIGDSDQEKFNKSVMEKGYDAEEDIVEMMLSRARGASVTTTNVRQSLLADIEEIPDLSEGGLSDRFFMIVQTPYQLESRDPSVPSREWLVRDRSYEAHECDEKGMLIGDQGLKIQFMLSDESNDHPDTLIKPTIHGQREPRKRRASDGAYFTREMGPPVIDFYHEM